MQRNCGLHAARLALLALLGVSVALRLLSAQESNAAPRAAGLTIVPQFDSSITSDPRAADIMATINSAIAVYEAHFSDPITVNITFKNVNTGLGASLTYRSFFNYADVRAAMAANATTADDAAALAHLPAQTNNPVTNTPDVLVVCALARALGFTGVDANPPPGQPDSIISLNIGLTNITAADTDPGKYSLFATAAHEIDEALGFVSEIKNGTDSPLDFFRYDGSGKRSYTTDSAALAYFSIDGTTDLAQFNQNPGGDYGDLGGSGPPLVQDAFGSPGENPVLGVELRVLDVIGYTPTGTAKPKPNLTLDAGGAVSVPATAKTGGPLALSVPVLNNGTADAGGFNVRFVLSTDTTFDAGDTIIGDAPVAALAAGAKTTATFSGACPAVAAGNYYVIAVIDNTNTVAESNENDNIFASAAQIAVSINTNHAPVISSAANYSPSPANPGVTLTFTVGATDADNDPLSVAWDFGDGSSGSGASATHAYSAPGSFTAIATITDGQGGSVMSSVTVQVSAPVFATKNISQKFTLNFKTHKDGIDVTTLSKDFATPANGTTIQFVIGDAAASLGVVVDKGTLSGGKAAGALGKFTLNTRSGSARYSTTKATLEALLASYGAANATKSATITVPIYFLFRGTYYGGSYSFKYKATAGKTGKGK